MSKHYKQTTTWEGYIESVEGIVPAASVDKLLEWITELKILRTRDPENKDCYDLEIEATKEILKLTPNE